MNKTIRANCFETNSSSTHSLTIVNINSDNKNDTALQLVIDGKLYPGNLGRSSAISSDQNDIEFYSEFVLTCTTVDEKAALLLHHIKRWPFHCEKYLEYVISKLIRVCEYAYIDDTFKSDFSGVGDEWNYIDDMFRNHKDELITKSNIDAHIVNVIMNPDMHIIEQYKEEY